MRFSCSILRQLIWLSCTKIHVYQSIYRLNLKPYTGHKYSFNGGWFMNESMKTLIAENVFYSHRALSFYRFFPSVQGNADIRELPTAVNSYLHSTLDLSNLNSKTLREFACIGRYYDEGEQDECELEYDKYSTTAINVDNEIASIVENISARKIISPRLIKAHQIAAIAHSSQRRKSDNSPYVNHLIDVQYLLLNLANVYDEDILIVGILHDVIEDTDVNKNVLLQEFGSRITRLVAALTDDKSLTLEQRRIHILKKLKNAPRSIKLVKLADICSNAAAIPQHWDDNRIREYFIWLDAVVALCKDLSPELATYYNSLQSETR